MPIKPPIGRKPAKPQVTKVASVRCKRLVQPPCNKEPHGLCTRGSCRFCCVVQGSCSVPGHNFDALSDAQQKKIKTFWATTKPSIPTLSNNQDEVRPTYTTRNQTDLGYDQLAWDDFIEVLQNDDPIRKMKLADQARIEKQREIDRLEAEREQLEDDEHDALIAATRAALRSPVSTQGGSGSSPLGTRVLQLPLSPQCH